MKLRGLLNPFALFEELFGPACCNRILCVLVVVVCMFAGLYAQPIFSLVQPVMAFANALGNPGKWAVLGPLMAVPLCLCVSCWLCCRRLRRGGTG